MSIIIFSNVCVMLWGKILYLEYTTPKLILFFKFFISLSAMDYMKKLIYVVANLLAWHKSTCICGMLAMWECKLI